MVYYVLISLPLILFFMRLLLTNHLVPYFKRQSLHQSLKTCVNGVWIQNTETFLSDLFKGTHAKISSRIYRAMHRISSKEFIYGEVDILSFYTLLQKTSPKKNDIFYDLGSGAGKAVFTAAFFFELAKSCGIELLPPLYKKACARLEQAEQLCIGPHPYAKKPSTIQFINDDFLTHDFFDADIIYIAATCLSDPTWRNLTQKMTGLKPGTRIIVATKSIDHPHFETLYEGTDLMSWGLCRVTIYITRGISLTKHSI